MRFESSPDAWRPFRWAAYLLVLGVAPIGLGGAFVIGGNFGTALLAALALNYGLAVFGVEFTVHTGRKPVTFEFDAAGLRVVGPGSLVRMLPWRDLSRVRVRAAGPRTSPSAAVFQFRAGMRMAIAGIDLTRHRDVAEGIAAMIARYAPHVPRLGRTQIFRWDPVYAADGDVIIEALAFQPRFYAGIALIGPTVNLEMTVAAWSIGILPEPSVAVAIVAAYLALGTVQLMFCRRMIRALVDRDGSAQPERSVRVLLGVGSALVLLEGLFGLRLVLL